MALRFLLLSAILGNTIAQQNVGDPINDFCRRHQQQTCIIDSRLYIDGGKVYYGGSVDNGTTAVQNTRLLWENVLDTQNDYKFPAQYNNLTKNPEVPSVSGGVLWPDSTNKLFYLFGGEYDSANDVEPFTTLWLYDILYNTWNRSSASDGSLTDIKWPALGAGTVTDTGTAYYYGGYLSNLSMPDWSGDRLMLNSLTSFNMNTRTWQNNTYDQTPRAEGSLLFIPASDSGMLVYFGGVEINEGLISYIWLQNIHLFDIANNRWFTQPASGDVPSPRRGSCVGVIWAKDKSSYNFYVYGGITSSGEAVDELYVLTLPSFQWTIIYPESVPNYLGGKAWMSCDVIRDSQMIIIGGQYTNTSSTECDVPKIGGQHGLLLGQEAIEQRAWWHAVQDNTTGYRVPDNIVALIGGEYVSNKHKTDGHATATAPATGFAVRDLSVYFGTTASASPRTASRYIPATNTASPTSQPSSDSNTGAIAGGVVGGVVGLAAVVGVIFFCLRHRRRKQAESDPAELSQTSAIGPSSPGMAHKTGAPYSIHGSSMHSPMAEAPAYTPQGSSPNSWNGEQANFYQGMSQTQQGAYDRPQPYYPPPPESAYSPNKPQSPQDMTHELPSTGTPALSELPHIKSPMPKRAL
ncbi:cell wall anchored protein [Stagonosporopsis vannaccii]|nr:cell wall anchored protein [Stagonosporopsis vannaccii]